MSGWVTCGGPSGEVWPDEQHDLLRPVPDPLPLLPRVAEQVADHDRRQARRDGLDRLALAERRDRVEDLGDDLADVLLVARARPAA